MSLKLEKMRRHSLGPASFPIYFSLFPFFFFLSFFFLSFFPPICSISPHHSSLSLVDFIGPRKHISSSLRRRRRLQRNRRPAYEHCQTLSRILGKLSLVLTSFRLLLRIGPRLSPPPRHWTVAVDYQVFVCGNRVSKRRRRRESQTNCEREICPDAQVSEDDQVSSWNHQGAA